MTSQRADSGHASLRPNARGRQSCASMRSPTRSPANDAEALDEFARWFADWWLRRGSRLLSEADDQPQMRAGVAGSTPQTRDLREVGDLQAFPCKTCPPRGDLLAAPRRNAHGEM